MNVFGIDLLQLIIYVCVASSFIVVIYILKLKRSRTKTEPAENEPEQLLSEDKTVIEQLIVLIDKMYSHQVGLTPTSTSNPNHEPERQTPVAETKEEEPKPTQTPSLPLSHIDEETYVPTSEDKKLLEKIRKLLKEKE